ncbi:hypothetical protein H4219_005331, partial [Mycoemilia scoparia]
MLLPQNAIIHSTKSTLHNITLVFTGFLSVQDLKKQYEANQLVQSITSTTITLATAFILYKIVMFILSRYSFNNNYNENDITKTKDSSKIAALIFVPSTSIYPSDFYTTPNTKIPIHTIINDFINDGTIQFRGVTPLASRSAEDEESKEYLLHEFNRFILFKQRLVDYYWFYRKIFPEYIMRTREREEEVWREYVENNGRLLEVILGPDRLSLIGCFHVQEDADDDDDDDDQAVGGVSNKTVVLDSLEDALNAQIDRITYSYLQLGDSIEEGLENDEEEIRRILEIKKKRRVLDTNGMWGDLGVYIADESKVAVDVLVPSVEQYEHLSSLVDASQFEDELVRGAFGSYHDLDDETSKLYKPDPILSQTESSNNFGNVSTLGKQMYSHALAIDTIDWIGAKNLEHFFKSVYDRLLPGGLFMIQMTSSNTTPKLSFGTENMQFHMFRLLELQYGADSWMFLSFEEYLSIIRKCGFQIQTIENISQDAILTYSVWNSRLVESKHIVEEE